MFLMSVYKCLFNDGEKERLLVMLGVFNDSRNFFLNFRVFDFILFLYK